MVFFDYYKFNKDKVTDTVPEVGTQAVLNDIKAHLRNPEHIKAIIVQMYSGTQHMYRGDLDA